ncbi:hypothetical protein E2C01_007709 [Portunus trituberculatus]|uniref:Uncharacterized protein n=1 Tax=Portunus trituberculatus TaxID=210409 RepID=A0A5B7CZP9_PORTR|nr:hypothetical protein [Portunus trituberculatus]
MSGVEVSHVDCAPNRRSGQNTNIDLTLCNVDITEPNSAGAHCQFKQLEGCGVMCGATEKSV